MNWTLAVRLSEPSGSRSQGPEKASEVLLRWGVPQHVVNSGSLLGQYLAQSPHLVEAGSGFCWDLVGKWFGRLAGSWELVGWILFTAEKNRPDRCRKEFLEFGVGEIWKRVRKYELLCADAAQDAFGLSERSPLPADVEERHVKQVVFGCILSATRFMVSELGLRLRLFVIASER